MQDWTEDIIPVETAGTLAGLFWERVRRSPERPAYRWHDRRSGQWQSIDWRGMAAQVARWHAALAGEGLKAGERVAVQLRNGVEWICFDQAAQALGLVAVPLYTEDRPDNVAYILQDAHCRVLLVQSATHWRRLAEAVSGLDFVQRVLVLDADDDTGSAGDARLRRVDAWLPDTAPISINSSSSWAMRARVTPVFSAMIQWSARST